MIRKYLIISAVAAGAFAIVVPALADTPGNFGGNGQAWEQTGDNHYTHKNGAPRMDWETGRKAIPGNAGAAQDANSGKGAENSAIIYRPGNEDLLDPHDTCGGIAC